MKKINRQDNIAISFPSEVKSTVDRLVQKAWPSFAEDCSLNSKILLVLLYAADHIDDIEPGSIEVERKQAGGEYCWSTIPRQKKDWISSLVLSAFPDMKGQGFNSHVNALFWVGKERIEKNSTFEIPSCAEVAVNVRVKSTAGIVNA